MKLINCLKSGLKSICHQSPEEDEMHEIAQDALDAFERLQTDANATPTQTT